MLIVNADDWGMNKCATDKSLSCFNNGRVTSASAMVFMNDSERAAELAFENNLNVGLHLNFTSKFSSSVRSPKLLEYHEKIAAFLLKNKYLFILYNPFLQNYFEYVYKAQFEEYVRLYKRNPPHIDGHHHMHLCMNMLITNLIPKGSKIRRNFTFSHNEKGLFKWLYRYLIDSWLKKRYICTDFLFNISPIKIQRLQNIIKLSISADVELEVHPEITEEYNFLMGNKYFRITSGTRIGIS